MVPQWGQDLGAGGAFSALTMDSPCESDSGGAVPATRNPGVARLAGVSPENPSGNHPSMAAIPPRAATPIAKLVTIRAWRVRGDTIRQISTWVPSSTTRLGGMLKKSVARVALRDIHAKR